MLQRTASAYLPCWITENDSTKCTVVWLVSFHFVTMNRVEYVCSVLGFFSVVQSGQLYLKSLLFVFVSAIRQVMTLIDCARLNDCNSYRLGEIKDSDTANSVPQC